MKKSKAVWFGDHCDKGIEPTSLYPISRQLFIQKSNELQVPKITAWKLLHDRLRFKPFKLKLLQVLTEGNTVRRAAICKDFIPSLEEEETLNLYFVCSDQAVFHLHGTVRKTNMIILSSNNCNASVGCEWDSSKVNVFCALLKTNVYCIFFYA